MQKRIRIIIAMFLTLLLVGASAQNVKSNQTYIEYCEEIGEAYGICPELLQALIERESNYDPRAKSSCGAVGLCQIIPKYQKERMKRLGVTDLYDPYGNILVCADILYEFAQKYDDLYLVLMCYNEGEYGNAKTKFERGEYSRYATYIVDRAAELERINGK